MNLRIKQIEENLKNADQDMDALKTIEEQTLLHQMFTSIVNKISETLPLIQELQQQVIDGELYQWKHRQKQHHMFGIEFNMNLDNIQQSCEFLSRALWMLRSNLIALIEKQRYSSIYQMIMFKILKSTIDRNSSSPLMSRITDLREIVSKLIQQLISSTFIVEEQPSAVVRKWYPLSAKIRLLFGSFFIQSAVVLVKLVNEEQAMEKLRNEQDQNNSNSGVILHNEQRLELNENGVLSALFSNMKIEKLKRSYGKSEHLPMFQMYYLLFEIKVKIKGEIELNVWTLSFPFLIIVSVHQIPRALGGIAWYNSSPTTVS